jgi:hypothetical protein
MMNAETHRKKIKPQTTVRATISFPPDHYYTLEEIGKQKKVSLAWVAREAAESYVSSAVKRGPVQTDIYERF